MKKFCHAFCVLLFAACAVHAADSSDDSPVDFMPTFDDLIQYVPKFTVRLGFRGLVGPKMSFTGTGSLISEGWTDTQGVGGDYEYHDGYVRPDTRTTTTPGGYTDPAAPDGATNTWQFVSASQLGTVDEANFVTMHSYSVTNTDTAFHDQSAGAAFGVELTGERDFGQLFGTKAHWGFIGGFSVNQIAGFLSANVPGQLTTRSDIRQLGNSAGLNSGGAPDTPVAPYTAPTYAGSADSSILLGTTILGTSTTTTAATLSDTYKLRGAYMTFRAGPTLHMPITAKLSANLSAGAILLYVGTDYEVTQSFLPATGDAMTTLLRDGASGFLPGYYVDADVQYDITDHDGFYLGGVYQGAGTYQQHITDSPATDSYIARIDFGSMQGVRAGFLFRF